MFCAAALAGSIEELTQGLGESTYSTKTRGERVQPGARAAARRVLNHELCYSQRDTSAPVNESG